MTSGSAPATSHCQLPTSNSQPGTSPRSTDSARSRRSNSAWNHQAWLTKSLPPVAIVRSTPSTQTTRLGTITCACKCGSSSRL